MTSLFAISPLYTATLTFVLPLIAFLYQACVGKKDSSGIVSLIAICGSFIFGVYTWSQIWNHTPVESTYSWFTLGKTTITFGLLLNNLSVLMLALVPTIALPVHIYSRSYMKGDNGIHRYWMYLSLFCFAMLGLVVMNSLFLMYIFWELVGFASYLLIGFWFTRASAVRANKKAFLVNRIGDLGFLIGLAIIYTQFGTFNITELFGKDGLVVQSVLTSELWINGAHILPDYWVTIAAFSFFLAAMAKSAQFPLQVWLPDAMEGPTSVSSLIHAATMVAAGVFLMATVFPVFNASILFFILIIGCITAAVGAYFALAQFDIKRILAFSTISQLGYMMVGIGVGAWDAAMFHLVTHAFFKCLLFLCAGAVIHELSILKTSSERQFDPQDIRNMGGLKKYMPVTFAVMTIASFALAGFPLTSGYLSKESIILNAFEWASDHGNGYYWIPVLLIIVSILTSFYIGRLIFKTFFGDFKLKSFLGEAHVHEAPELMLIPMIFLAVCSIFPLFSLHPLNDEYAWILDGLKVEKAGQHIHHTAHTVIPWILFAGSIAVWILGWKWYVRNTYPLSRSTIVQTQLERTFDNSSLNFLQKLSLHQGYMNELNSIIIVKNILRISKMASWFDQHIVDGIVNSTATMTRKTANIASWIDKNIIDGIVNGVAKIAYSIGLAFRTVQNGKLQTYIISSICFMILICSVLFYLIFYS